MSRIDPYLQLIAGLPHSPAYAELYWDLRMCAEMIAQTDRVQDQYLKREA